jgi:hypothetical protein
MPAPSKIDAAEPSVTEWNELYIIDAAIMAVTCSYAATSVKLLAFRDTSVA